VAIDVGAAEETSLAVGFDVGAGDGAGNGATDRVDGAVDGAAERGPERGTELSETSVEVGLAVLAMVGSFPEGSSDSPEVWDVASVLHGAPRWRGWVRGR